MSAFVCSDDHFIALAVFATHRKHGGPLRVDPRYIQGWPEERRMEVFGMDRTDMANEYANLLLSENERSVNARYNDGTGNGFIDVKNRHFNHVNWVLEPIQILKMCDGLEYQSCETKDYRESVAYQLLSKIRKAAIQALPGYNDAPWDYCVQDKAA